MRGWAALDVGLADQLVPPGDVIARAEAWLLSSPVAIQPWDRADHDPAPPAAIGDVIAPARSSVLSTTLGHHPAPLAILDCVEFGLPQLFDGAIRSEMALFAHLIQREEARNMIRTQFLAKTDYQRLRRKDAVPAFIELAVVAAKKALATSDDRGAQAMAGFGGHAEPVRERTRPGYWIDTPEGAGARAVIASIDAAVAPFGRDRLSGLSRRPTYLRSPLAPTRHRSVGGRPDDLDGF